MIRLLLPFAAVSAAVVAMLLADPYEASAEPDNTVNLSELRTVDGVDYPVCFVEDCSDQPNQLGLWEDQDTGNWYLSLGEDLSVLVVDDTTTN